MAENMKVDEVGRRIETRVYETVIDGQKERVVETHVEQIPMVLSERVIEKIVPVVTNRKKETYKDGKISDSFVEELDHGTIKMSAASVNNVLTKEDLMDAIREVLNGIKVDPVVNPTPVVSPNPVVNPNPVVSPDPIINSTPAFMDKVWEIVEIGAYIILSGEVAYCLYQLVLKNFI